MQHETSHPAVDGRADHRVAQLKPRVLHGRLVGPHDLLGAPDGGVVDAHGLLGAGDVGLVGAQRGVERVVRRLDLIVLLARNQLLAEEIAIPALLRLGVLGLRHVAGEGRLRLADARPVALEHGPRLLDLAAIARERRLRLGQRGLVHARIDREEQVALLHVLTFLDVNPHELAAHLRPDGHDRVRLDRSDGLHEQRDRLLLDGRHRHRNRRAARRCLGLHLALGAGRRRDQHDGQDQTETVRHPRASAECVD